MHTTNQKLKGKMSSISTFFVAFTMLLMPNFVLAATHYVSPAGSASWSQSQNISQPCSASTAMSNATAGDLVYFRGGTYDPGDALDYTHPAMYPDNSGTAGNPITLKAYPGETVILVGNSKGPTFGANNRDWIVWDGFTTSVVPFVPQGVQRAVTFVNSDHCTIKNCDITGLIKTWGANNMCIGSYGTNYLTIENNKLHDSFNTDVTEVNSCAIMMYSTTNATIRNNDIYHCGAGIFDKNHGRDNSFYYNHIWNCSLGINVGNEGSPLGAYNQKAYQNILRDCVESIAIMGSASSTTDDFQIYNNVIVNNGGVIGTTRGITLNTGSRDAIVYNNIIVNYQNAVRYYSGIAEVSYSDQNDFYNASYWNMDSYGGTDYSSLSLWRAETSFDMNSIISDPLFKNAGGATPDDYKLTDGSPCKGTGKDGVDMGAFITGNEQIGYSQLSQTPGTPSYFETN
jgi:hypothetical protein